MKKTIKRRMERETQGQKNDEKIPQGAVPAYLLDREPKYFPTGLSRREEKAGKWRSLYPKFVPREKKKYGKLLKQEKEKRRLGRGRLLKSALLVMV